MSYLNHSNHSQISLKSVCGSESSKNTETDIILDLNEITIKKPIKALNFSSVPHRLVDLNFDFHKDNQTSTFRDILAQIEASTSGIKDNNKNSSHHHQHSISSDRNSKSPIFREKFQSEESDKSSFISDNRQEMKIKKLSDEMMRFQSNLVRSRKTVTDMNSKILALKNELFQEKEANKALIDKNEYHLQELVVLNNFLQQQKQENQSLKQKYESLLKQISEPKNKLRSSSDLNKNLSQSLKLVNLSNTQLVKEKNLILNIEIGDLKNKLQSNEEELNKVKAQSLGEKNDLQLNIQKNLELIDSKTTQIQKLNKKLSDQLLAINEITQLHDKEIEKLTTKLKSQDIIIKANEMKLKLEEKLKKDLESEKKHYCEASLLLENKVKELLKDGQEKDEKHRLNIQNILDMKQSDQKQLNDSIQAYREEIMNINKENEEYKKQIMIIKGNDMQARMKDEIENLEKNLVKKTDENKNLADEIAEIKTEKDKLIIKLMHLEEDYEHEILENKMKKKRRRDLQ